MATVDLGKLAFVNKGTWSSATAYAVRDVVQHTDHNETSTYLAVQASANQAPSTTERLILPTGHYSKRNSPASNNQGTYASGTTYEKGDVVQYTDSGVTSTFLYVNTTSASGQTPSTSGTVNPLLAISCQELIVLVLVGNQCKLQTSLQLQAELIQ